MKRLLVTLLLIIIGVFTVTPAFAMDACDHEMNHEATIAALQMHVEHAYTMGHITNQGVYTSLQATLARAAEFAQEGRTEQAVRQLEVFSQKVQAQAGSTIEVACAEHLVMHAEHVIHALTGAM